MLKSEMAASLAVIQELFDRFKLTEMVVDIWYMACGKHDLKEFQRALKEHCATSIYSPMPAHVNEIIARYHHDDLTASDGFMLVQRAVGKYGTYSIEAAIMSLPDKVVKAIGGVEGFKAFCLSDCSQLTTYRAQFIKAFENYVVKERNTSKTLGMLDKRVDKLVKNLTEDISRTQKLLDDTK